MTDLFVKPLVWIYNKDGTTGARAHTAFGDYCVYGGIWWRDWTADKPVKVNEEGAVESSFERAILAAEADFRQRVMSHVV